VEDLLKKLPTVLDTPARVMLAVVAIMLVGEILTLLLSESLHATILKDAVLKKWLIEIIDPIALVHHDCFFPLIAADLQAYEC